MQEINMGFRDENWWTYALRLGSNSEVQSVVTTARDYEHGIVRRQLKVLHVFVWILLMNG
jgi:hypothetical protein